MILQGVLVCVCFGFGYFVFHPFFVETGGDGAMPILIIVYGAYAI